MKQKSWIRILIVLAVIAALIVVLVLASGGSQDFSDKYKGEDLSKTGEQDRTDGYPEYLASWSDLPSLASEIEVDVTDFRLVAAGADAFEYGEATATDLAVVEQDEEGAYLHTASGSFVAWTVKDVPAECMANIVVTYRAPESRGVDLERALYLDDGNGLVIPYDGADSLTFYRIWHDGEMDESRRLDNQGNQRRPSQVEIIAWQEVYLKDAMGYEVNPYQIHLQPGDNVIAFRAVNEPMDIRSIRIVPVQSFRSYDEYAAQYEGAEVGEGSKDYIGTIEAEGLVIGEDGKVTFDFQRRSSSPSLYARYDRSSPATVPYDVYHTVFNYIGGDAWNAAGQWIEWTFEVPESGWYNITIKARQNHQRGAISCRTLYIDGEVPFREMATLSFSYENAWGMYTLQRETAWDENGKATATENARFYLEAGRHTIRLEATLGEMGPILQEMKNSLDRLNRIYRRILVLTGVNPDRFRDYNLESTYPEVIEAMDLESKRLYKLVDDTVRITGQKSDRVAVAQTLAVQLEGFVIHTERITQSFGNFKDNITSLGTAMQNMSETKLDIDQIIISGENAQLPTLSQGFFPGFGHEIRSLVASYTVDYDALGDKYDDNERVLEVWITTGRDQSTILKSMIDQSFTTKYGVRVNVKLVLADTLLTAVVAGNGPDVVLSVGSWFPVNYAMRNAVEPMDQFDADWVAANFEAGEDGTYTVKSYDEVVTDYYDSALQPFRYNGHVWALPETQEFSVIFYRTDVLAEYGITVEDLSTWEGLIALLPTIQGNNMDVGVPYPDIANPDMSVLNSLIYQYGGRIYDDNAMRTEIDSEAGVAAFKLYTSLYNDYGLPIVYDFVSRFRTGQMPIGVANYSMYNTLAVSAPEIRGLWDFTYFPGTYRGDGVINPGTGEPAADGIDRTVHAQGLCCMIIATDDEDIKRDAWIFLQWWTDAETQVEFGREMESVLGSSARYTTANKRALKQLGWSDDQYAILSEQMSWTRGFPEIAGGYSTTRHMTNAIRRVINNKEDARETLLTYTQTINEEIKIKRREFGLPTSEAELLEAQQGTAAPPDEGGGSGETPDTAGTPAGQ